MNLFTYGTLQFDEVWSQTAGIAVDKMAGEVAGYAVYRVDGREYPGMTPEPAGIAAGMVYLVINDAVLARLDHFEGDEYQRTTVSVSCADGATQDCQAYIVPTEWRSLLTDDLWTRESFLASGALARFLNR